MDGLSFVSAMLTKKVKRNTGAIIKLNVWHSLYEIRIRMCSMILFIVFDIIGLRQSLVKKLKQLLWISLSLLVTITPTILV